MELSLEFTPDCAVSLTRAYLRTRMRARSRYPWMLAWRSRFAETRMHAGSKALANPGEASIEALLLRWQGGDLSARDRVMECIYPDLHAIAHRHMKKQGRNHTLQTTALVNETLIRFLENKKVEFKDRLHLLRLSALVMRRLLCDHARAKGRHSRKPPGMPIDVAALITPERLSELDPIDLEAALERLDEFDTQLAALVDLRYFHGLTMDECAEILKTPKSTLEKRWPTARAFIARELSR